ncbi:MAG: hypothetical protein ACI9KM_002307 [Rubritalea sp.]
MRLKIFFNSCCIALLLGLVACSSTGTRYVVATNDSGFGGTGITIANMDDDGPGGFGGTGIIGTISAFGSIWVNGIEVEYADDVKIRSNLLGADDHLKLGQVVILETDVNLDNQQHPTTQAIRIHYPLAGQIQQVEPNQLQVNDQWVAYNHDVPMDAGLQLKVGQFIAINATQQDSDSWTATRFNHNHAKSVIDRPKLNIDFSSRVRNIIVDTRMMLMRNHWNIRVDRQLLKVNNPRQLKTIVRGWHPPQEKMPPAGLLPSGRPPVPASGMLPQSKEMHQGMSQDRDNSRQQLQLLREDGTTRHQFEGLHLMREMRRSLNNDAHRARHAPPPRGQPPRFSPSPK